MLENFTLLSLVQTVEILVHVAVMGDLVAVRKNRLDHLGMSLDDVAGYEESAGNAKITVQLEDAGQRGGHTVSGFGDRGNMIRRIGIPADRAGLAIDVPAKRHAAAFAVRPFKVRDVVVGQCRILRLHKARHVRVPRLTDSHAGQGQTWQRRLST